jgi:hypothetical protein
MLTSVGLRDVARVRDTPKGLLKKARQIDDKKAVEKPRSSSRVDWPHTSNTLDAQGDADGRKIAVSGT